MDNEKTKATNPSLEGKMEDGGERMQFEGGALREPTKGKGRFDLISPFALHRIVNWDHNADQDYMGWSFFDAAFDNLNEFRMGHRKKDRLAAAARYIIAQLTCAYHNKENMWWGVIHPQILKRLAIWYELGGEKYPPRNWESGMSYSRLIDSAMRHMNRWADGETGEDHPIAALWNIFAYMHYEAVGLTKFDDTPRYPEANVDWRKANPGMGQLLDEMCDWNWVPSPIMIRCKASKDIAKQIEEGLRQGLAMEPIRLVIPGEEKIESVRREPKVRRSDSFDAMAGAITALKTNGPSEEEPRMTYDEWYNEYSKKELLRLADKEAEDKKKQHKIKKLYEAEAKKRQKEWEEATFNPVFTAADGTTRRRAIAVDFDGTLCTSAWPGIGKANKWLIEKLKKFREDGGELILWTNREGALQESAVAFCAYHGLHFDAVNANLESWKKCFGNDTRKVGCDLYIDDKALCIMARG